ncbi:sensor histidine kinase [Pelagibius marinus]|uniref:sensor histidine kinase n=1 Tax=Pelagibius marinus TaxID=2762760 RepID=UPI0018727340|nr:sensor histidine kinase [Pelagibius marinus]
MKLRYLLLLIFGLVTVVPLVLFWAWPHAQSISNELEDVRDRHLLIAETLGISLETYHRDVEATFRLISGNLTAHGHLEGAESLLQDLNFRNVCAFDSADRRITLRIDSFDNRCPEVLSPEDYEFYRSFVSAGEVAMSPVISGSDGAPAIYIATMRGDLLVVGALYTDFFVRLAESISFGREGHAIIVDQTGQVLAHPNDQWQREHRAMTNTEPVQKIMQGEAGIAIFDAPLMKTEMVAAFTVIKGIGWGVMVVQPIDELRDRAEQVSRSAMIVVAIGVVIALLIGVLVAYYMTRPLRAVSHAARRMAAGNAEARTPVSEGALVPEEVRDLQTSFNVMAEAMERSKRDEHEARLRAEEANRSKSAFLANMSHELRTPLNAILGFSEVILAETFGKIGSTRYEEYLQDIRGSARHLLELINDLLDLSRIEAGAVKLNESWFPVADALEESAAMFRENCASGGLDLSVENGAEGRVILADGRALRQILINLLSNAVRHTPAGGSIIVGAQLAAEGALDIFVADTGVGIPAGDLERVLHPFEQVASDQTLQQEGTGLGLSIVKQLVDLHGGKLKLVSEVGKGTTVTFTLPPQRVMRNEEGGNRQAAF